MAALENDEKNFPPLAQSKPLSLNTARHENEEDAGHEEQSSKEARYPWAPMVILMTDKRAYCLIHELLLNVLNIIIILHTNYTALILCISV